MRNGTFLYIPRGVEIDLPIEAYHWLHGENGSCSSAHLLIIAADTNSRVTFVDYFFPPARRRRPVSPAG